MSRVYVLDSSGNSEAMDRIHCKNEDQELQRVLELNPDLIPGDQINPAEPRRWIVIKREMPVPDPSTGGNRWSVDFFFADQDAMPTFIECKRCNDTRAKREVVGQMLEYAANGHYYWSKNEMRTFAEQTANDNGVSLEEEIKRLQPEDTESVEEFFQRVQENLREGQVRLVFFMDDSPPELKSVVDFLNKQMERSEVLLVEARQYEYNNQRIISPILFGFTEEARQVKKVVSVNTGQKRKWDSESFFADLGKRVTSEQYASVKKVFDKSQELKCELSWGSGKIDGTFSAKWPHLGRHSVFTVVSHGTLTNNYGGFKGTPEQRGFISFLKDELYNRLGLIAPEDYERRYPNYKVELWAGQVDELLSVLELMLERYPPSVKLVASSP